MAKGKWITELSAQTPIADAARHVLAVRLEAVRDYLGLALRKADKNIEHVHQLRVGTRRASAALAIFADCLPKKVRRQTGNHLKHLRKTAGGARDWDVFLNRLAQDAPRHPPEHGPGLDFLFGYGLGHRIPAQAALEQSSPNYPFSFERLMSRTIACVQSPGNTVLVERAREVLSHRLQALDSALAEDLGDYRRLHQVRIVGKKLRYGMEVFAGCFGSSFRKQLYQAVAEMQEILGHANDHYAALESFKTIRRKMKNMFPDQWARFRNVVEDLISHHRQHLPQQRAQFDEWYRRWCDAGYAAAFDDLLTCDDPKDFRFQPNTSSNPTETPDEKPSDPANGSGDTLPALSVQDNSAEELSPALDNSADESTPPNGRSKTVAPAADALQRRIDELKQKHAESATMGDLARKP